MSRPRNLNEPSNHPAHVSVFSRKYLVLFRVRHGFSPWAMISPGENSLTPLLCYEDFGEGYFRWDLALDSCLSVLSDSSGLFVSAFRLTLRLFESGDSTATAMRLVETTRWGRKVVP